MSLVPVLHMYNAALQSGQLTKTWHDLEEIIDFYGAGYIFVGDRHIAFDAAVTRLSLALGLSPAAVKREQRKKQSTGNRQPANPVQKLQLTGRILQPKLPFLTIMRERYKVAGKKQSSMVLNEVETAVNALSDTDADMPDEIVKIVRQWKQSRTVTPMGLLKIIEHNVVLEDYELHFDYIDINRRCVELLRRIRDTVQKEHPTSPLLEACSENDKLCFVPQVVLCFGLDTSSSTEEDSPRSILDIAARCMESFIDREGSKESEKALRMVRLPLHKAEGG